MKFNPRTEPSGLPYSPFKSCVAPRPIGWLSSVSQHGVENIAPYSQWQLLTADPPMVMFSANHYPDGRRKDTAINAEETGWFIFNMATYELREEVVKSAMPLARGESEWDYLDLTKEYADNYRIPMVKQSPVKFECSYMSTQFLEGSSKKGSVDVIFARVETIHIDDTALTDSGLLNTPKIQPIARLGYFDYAVVSETFEMRVPKVEQFRD